MSHNQQEPFFDEYVKNIHFILNVYHPESQTVKMIVLSIADAGQLEKLLFSKDPKPENIWIESPVGDIYCGKKPNELPPSYYNQMQQINYLAGNLGHIYTNLDKATWLQQETAKKMAFYKRHLARIRDARPQIIEMLTSKLSAIPIEKKEQLDVPEPKPLTTQYSARRVSDRGEELNEEPSKERKVALDAPQPEKPLTAQYNAILASEREESSQDRKVALDAPQPKKPSTTPHDNWQPEGSEKEGPPKSKPSTE